MHPPCDNCHASTKEVLAVKCLGQEDEVLFLLHSPVRRQFGLGSGKNLGAHLRGLHWNVNSCVNFKCDLDLKCFHL